MTWGDKVAVGLIAAAAACWTSGAGYVAWWHDRSPAPQLGLCYTAGKVTGTTHATCAGVWYPATTPMESQ